MPGKKTYLQKVTIFLASGCGVGFLPGAPGTYGSLLAIPLYLLVSGLPFLVYCLGLLALLFFSIAICGRAEAYLQTKDPSSVVLDEILGLLVAMAGMAPSLLSVGGGFIFFRIFDVLKPPPVVQIDRNVAGGLGIVADDVIAGIMANLATRFVLHLAMGVPL